MAAAFGIRLSLASFAGRACRSVGQDDRVRRFAASSRYAYAPAGADPAAWSVQANTERKGRQR
jgi:hypothetical protein